MIPQTKRRTRVTLAALVAVCLAYWLSTPSGATPGSPLRMVDAHGTDLGVAALTISEGPDNRWPHLADAAYTRVPPRWLHTLGIHGNGNGQKFARARGVEVAAGVLGVPRPQRPEAVSPGEVNGTSSGLAWALATLLLNDPELRAGAVVYATGTLYRNGVVGVVGELDAKLRTPGLADATMVFVPAPQYHQAMATLRTNDNREVAAHVIGVKNVMEALRALCQRTPQAPTCRSRWPHKT